MQVEQRHEFPKPRQTVLKMFSDRRYFKRKSEMIGATAFEVLESECTEEHFRIRYRFLTQADIPLPEFAKKFVRDSMQVIQQDTWDLKKGIGHLDIEIRGMPLTLFSDMVIEDNKAGCANLLKFTIKCPVPLVGGRFEKVLAQDVMVKSKADHDASLVILQDY